MMKNIRFLTWAIIAVMCGYLGWNYFLANKGSMQGAIKNVASIGGPFDLVRHDGSPITDKDLVGKPHVIFFGFTHCPEICPTTLFEATGWLEAIKNDGDKLGVYFFTVDPDRDTAEVLADYMGSFDPRIIGVTGTSKNMQQAINAYRVYSKKVPLDDGDYTMDHTATVYLMNADGSFSGTISYGETTDTAVTKLKNLIGKNQG